MQHFVVIFGRLRVIFRKVIQLGALVNNIVCSQGASSVSGVLIIQRNDLYKKANQINNEEVLDVNLQSVKQKYCFLNISFLPPSHVLTDLLHKCKIGAR